MLRLLLPVMAGILFQWQAEFPLPVIICIGSTAIFFIAVFFYLPFIHRYQLSFVNGSFTCLLFISLGAFLTYHQDIRHDKKWFGHYYEDSMALVLRLDEPLVEKPKSWKAQATVRYIQTHQQFFPVKGKLIVYFSKDLGNSGHLRYGSQLILKKTVQEIKSMGNPGSFDYKRYCLFQSITHQVYLKSGDFELTGNSNQSGWTRFIYTTRKKITGILRTYIRNEKELALAEALLIGYKDDLDKALVQSYSDTGVVHIIAISGLHLGLIYWLLNLLLLPLQKKKHTRWLPPLLVISCLWLFSLLAGAQPSVLRSALMFTCIVAGQSLARKTTIYNTLALSAFLLLCYNPYWLWDLGFQLSYAALLSIIIYNRPFYNLFYFKNRIADAVWKLNAVTLSAQVLTIPLCIYHFHQFPNYFLLANLVAVPLSSLILLLEILLCAVSFSAVAAGMVAKALTPLITLMNFMVEKIASFPFATWDGLQVSIGQSVLLIVLIAGFSYGVKGSKNGIKTGLLASLGFVLLRSWSFAQTGEQQKIIVYNVPGKKAIDFIQGHTFFFSGDSLLQTDDYVRNFYLRPSRTYHRALVSATIDQLNINEGYITFGRTHILWIDKPVSFPPLSQKQIIDLLVLSQNPRMQLTRLAGTMDIRQVVFDASVPVWKVKAWKKECDQLHIPSHDVTAKGAFVMTLR